MAGGGLLPAGAHRAGGVDHGHPGGGGGGLQGQQGPGGGIRQRHGTHSYPRRSRRTTSFFRARIISSTTTTSPTYEATWRARAEGGRPLASSMVKNISSPPSRMGM